jgi:ornithine--oxo-acid transaminase
LICDEVQTGLGRTGKFLCSEHDGVRPDILILGKSLSGGFLPVSAVLCDDHIMNHIKPGQHGSTYGGTPLACEVAMKAIQVTLEEKMTENSEKLGAYLMDNLKKILVSNKLKELRGKGLFIGAEFEESEIAN